MNDLDKLKKWCKKKEAAYSDLHKKYHDPYYFTTEIVYGNVLEKIAELQGK
jgi:hypothetical protein